MGCTPRVLCVARRDFLLLRPGSRAGLARAVLRNGCGFWEGVQEFRVSIRLTGALESDCFLLMVLLGFLKVQDFGAGRGLGLRATYTYVLFKTCTWIGIYICGKLRRLLPFGVNLHASEMPKLALAGFEHELFCALRHVQD